MSYTSYKRISFNPARRHHLLVSVLKTRACSKSWSSFSSLNLTSGEQSRLSHSRVRPNITAVRSSCCHTFLSLILAVVSLSLILGDGVTRELKAGEHLPLLQYYNCKYPDAQVVSHRAQQAHSAANFLTARARFYTHFILSGHRISASDSLVAAPNSIVQVNFGVHRYVGQIFQIFRHYQPQVPESEKTTLLHVKWFRPLQNAPSWLWDS